MKRIISVALIFVMLLACFACSAAAESTIDQELLDYFMQKANEVVVNEDSVTFTDDSGRDAITIPKNPEKTTVLYGSLVCLWYEAGGEAACVVGGDTDKTLYAEQIGRDITLDENVKIIADSSNGKNWDVEAIIAENPDLLVVSVSKRGYETISGVAEAAGVPIIAVQYDSVQDYLKYFKVFCHISGHSELWEEVAVSTAEKITEIISMVPSDVVAPRALTIRLNQGDLRGQGNDSQTGSMIKQLGGINVVEVDSENGMSEQVEISMEDIYALDPDVIFIITVVDEEHTRAQHEELVKDDPVWPELRAVKEGKVYFIEKGLFNNKPNSNYQEAYARMAEYLYPEYEF